MDIRLLGWLIGYILGWLLGQAQGGAWDDASVRVTNQVVATTAHATGTILGGDGETGFVLTVRHLLDDGTGRLVVMRKDGHGYRAKLWARDEDADLSLLAIRDTGDLPTVRLAARQPPVGTMARGGQGRLTGMSIDGDSFYTFHPVEGDSGAGVFAPDGTLADVVWGRDAEGGAAVGTARLRSFMARVERQSLADERREKTVNPASLIMLAALAQSPATQPDLPSKGPPEVRMPDLPRKTMPTPQAPPARSSPQGATQYDSPGPSEYAQTFTVPARSYTFRRRVEVRELPPVVEVRELPPVVEFESVPAVTRAAPAIAFEGFACPPGFVCRPRLGLFGGGLGERLKSKSVVKYRRGPFAGL